MSSRTSPEERFPALEDVDEDRKNPSDDVDVSGSTLPTQSSRLEARFRTQRSELADALRDLADEVEPDDWMHDRRGRPL